MDSQAPAQNATCSQGGSLRVAILLMAMFGFMTLWSNMRDDLSDCEISLSARLNMKPEEARSKLFVLSRVLRAEYRPIAAAISSNLGKVNDYLAEVRQRVKLRRTAQKTHKSIALAAVRALHRVDSKQLQTVAMNLVNDFEKRMRHMAVESMQKLINETGYRVELIRMELRISDLHNGEHSTR